MPGREYAKMETLVFMYNVVKRFKLEKAIPNEKIAHRASFVPVNDLMEINLQVSNELFIEVYISNYVCANLFCIFIGQVNGIALGNVYMYILVSD